MDLLLEAVEQGNSTISEENSNLNENCASRPIGNARKPCKQADPTCWEVIRRQCIEEGVSISYVASLLGLHKSTVSKIVKSMRQGKMGPLKRGGRKKTLTAEQERMLCDLMDEDCTRTQKFLKSYALDNWNVTLSTRTIARTLKSFHYSLKRTSEVPVARNTPETIQKRKEFMEQIHLHLPNSKNLFFIDEVGFQVSMRRRYGWSTRGSRANVTVPALRTKNYSVCAAMNNENLWLYRLQDRPYNADDFQIFMLELCHLIRENGYENVVFIMDNARIHRPEALRQIVSGFGHSVLFNAPYSPMLNPIENLFAKWKGIVRQACPSNEQDLLEKINSASFEITSSDCIGYFSNMLSYSMPALQGLPIMN